MSKAFFALVLVVVVAASTAASARPHAPCWADLVAKPSAFAIDRIPVGCEVIDCCPGCPLANVLDWRVNVAGKALEAVELSFENLPPARLSGLALTGKAARGIDRLRVANGTGTVEALPVLNGGRPPVATMKLIFDRAWRPGATPSANHVQLRLEQVLGNVVVAEYELAYDIRDCPPPSTTTTAAVDDRINLTTNRGGDSAVLLISGRRQASGSPICETFVNRRATASVTVDNEMPQASCLDSPMIAVFSDDDAMALLTAPGGPAWTNNKGDVVSIAQAARLMVPVKVWRAAEFAPDIVASEILAANATYNTQNTGVGFTAEVEKITDEQVDLFGIIQCPASITDSAMYFGMLAQNSLFEAGKVNVYYLPRAFTGVNCPTQRNGVFVGTERKPSTLAHELGHALSLAHAEGTEYEKNVMYPGGADRDEITEGQAFRMNAHCSSVINTNSVRPGAWPKKACGMTETMEPTPALCSGSVPTDCPPWDWDVEPN